MMVFFQTRLVKILIWEKFSEAWESDFNVINKTRQAADFGSLPLSCKEIAEVMWKCQMSFSLSKILTCYLVQVYTLKWWTYCYRFKKLFWKHKLLHQRCFLWYFEIVLNSNSKEQPGIPASLFSLLLSWLIIAAQWLLEVELLFYLEWVLEVESIFGL